MHWFTVIHPQYGPAERKPDMLPGRVDSNFNLTKVTEQKSLKIARYYVTFKMSYHISYSAVLLCVQPESQMNY